VSGEIRVSLTLREIYDILCDDCKQKLKRLIRDRISEELVDRAIGL
jgi:hypothetical protein